LVLFFFTKICRTIFLGLCWAPNPNFARVRVTCKVLFSTSSTHSWLQVHYLVLLQCFRISIVSSFQLDLILNLNE
jgi:hypothetical protein